MEETEIVMEEEDLIVMVETEEAEVEAPQSTKEEENQVLTADDCLSSKNQNI
jgi:hypothetical protein